HQTPLRPVQEGPRAIGRSGTRRRELSLLPRRDRVLVQPTDTRTASSQTRWLGSRSMRPQRLVERSASCVEPAEPGAQGRLSRAAGPDVYARSGPGTIAICIVL